MVFLTLLWLDHGLLAESFDKGETHLGHRCSTVKTPLLLHLYNQMFQGLLLILGKLQSLHHHSITFDELGGGKTNRNVSPLGMIFNQMHDAVQATVYSTTMIVLVAEILTNRCFLILCDMDGMFHQLGDTLVFGGRDRHHRQTQDLFHFVHQNGTAIVAHLIHHIEGQHHGNTQFHQLHGQIEVTLDIVGIHNVDDGLRLFLNDELP